MATDTALTAVTRSEHIGARATQTGARRGRAWRVPAWAALLVVAFGLGVGVYALTHPRESSEPLALAALGAGVGSRAAAPGDGTGLSAANGPHGVPLRRTPRDPSWS